MLLDEIEKAHPDIFNILLQVMDHATLTDNNGRKADFRQVVADHDVERRLARDERRQHRLLANRAASDRAIDARQKVVAGSARRARSRRCSAPSSATASTRSSSFGPLTPDVMETIVEKFILQLEAQLAERRVAITLQPEARAWLAEKGYDPVFGARPLARVIQTEVRDPLTDEILFGRLEQGGTVTIGLADGKLTFEFGAPSAGADRARRRAAKPDDADKSTRSPSRSSTAAGG